MNSVEPPVAARSDNRIATLRQSIGPLFVCVRQGDLSAFVNRIANRDAVGDFDRSAAELHVSNRDLA